MGGESQHRIGLKSGVWIGAPDEEPAPGRPAASQEILELCGSELRGVRAVQGQPRNIDHSRRLRVPQRLAKLDIDVHRTRTGSGRGLEGPQRRSSGGLTVR
jgi:hypothetical protein